MHNLIEALRRSPTPDALDRRTPLVEAIKQAHVAMVRASLGDTTTSRQTDISALRDYALWLEGIAMERSDETEEDYCALAASLYEFAGTLTAPDGPIDIFVAPLNDLIRGAIGSSLTAFQAQSTLIARRVVAQLRAFTTDTALERCEIVAALAIASLLAREFPASFRYGRQLTGMIAEIVEHFESERTSNAWRLHIDRMLALGNACGIAGLGMLSGSEPLLRHAIGRVQTVRDHALDRQDANVFWLADRLVSAIARMVETNIRIQLAPTHLPPVYADSLARDGFYEFWGPQREAIRKGLLNRDRSSHFVIAVPTGSGKSLFAELGILNALGTDRDGWAVYVAPTRALVSQASSELRHRLGRCGISVRTIVAGAEQSAALDEELSLLGTTRSVTVTTPEKLDAYYRNARELFDSCKVIVFDEAHKIGDQGRGTLIESLVARFLVLQPGTQIVMLSGMMENATELAAWLGDAETEVVTTEKRATRQLFGVACRTDVTPADPRRGLSRRVGFAGGIVFVHEEDDLAGQIHIDLPAVFRGHYRERLNDRSGRWQEDRALDHSSATDHAISLAAAWSRKGGPILVFVSNIASARKGCRELLIASRAPTRQAAARLARYIADELGDEHELVRFCERGVAYHHARLPGNVQRAIELALQEGWLDAVFATPTLREGVNTAVRTVVVAGTHYYNAATGSQDEMAEADFLNIAGRAGRPRVDTEGRIILIPDRLTQAVAVQDGKKYILAGEAVRRVLSQFNAVAVDISRCRGQFLALAPANQSLLLALEAAGLAEESQLADFLGSTLWAVQEQVLVPSETAHVLSDVLARARVEVGAERVALASRLGLSLSSSEQLYDALAANIPLFVGSDDDDEKRAAQLTCLVQCSLRLPEIAQGELRDGDPSAHVQPLRSWLAGESYTRVLAIATESGVLGAGDDVTEAVKYCSDMGTWLSWAFGAAYTVLRSIIEEELDPYIGALPLLVRYGVPDTIAAYIALLGVSDRTASRHLSDAFAATGRPTNLSEVTRWLGESDAKEWLPGEDEDSVRLQLIRRHVSGRGFGDDLFVPLVFDASERLSLGTVLTCRLNDEYLLWFDGQRQVATTPFEGSAKSLLRMGIGRVVGVVTDVAFNRRSGSIVATMGG
jgi:hypothetical protein